MLLGVCCQFLSSSQAKQIPSDCQAAPFGCATPTSGELQQCHCAVSTLPSMQASGTDTVPTHAIAACHAGQLVLAHSHYIVAARFVTTPPGQRKRFAVIMAKFSCRRHPCWLVDCDTAPALEPERVLQSSLADVAAALTPAGLLRCRLLHQHWPVRALCSHHWRVWLQLCERE